MNILWIEDFGKLDPGTSTLSLMFQDLISFEDWDEDEVSLLNHPSGLESFFKANSDVHCVSLCRHYFDYIQFKESHDILKKIDAVIIDIRLDNNVDFKLSIPSNSQEKRKFHINAGFYIYNDLVHLGIPAEKMCFMTGEKNTFIEFEKKCHDIYIPKVTGFEKNDAEYEKLRKWIQEINSDYMVLRREIIEGCAFLKEHIERDDNNIQLRDAIKIENNQPAIEILNTDIKNYLDTLSTFLTLKEPTNKENSNVQYRLFLRTLVHEWEDNISAISFKERHEHDLSKNNDTYTFMWIMKMTRNWVSHANLLEPLTHRIMAFLFMVNMRGMFKLPKAIQPYEKALLRCISTSPKSDFQNLDKNISYANQSVDGILAFREEKQRHFGAKINDIYRQSTGNPNAEEHDFRMFLLQYFWINQKEESKNLTTHSDEFLLTLAQHIYGLSFPKDKDYNH